jgi:hypothetical protein
MAELLNQALNAEGKFSYLQSSTQWAIRGGEVTARIFADQRPDTTWAAPEDYNLIVYLHPHRRQLPPALAPDARTFDAGLCGAFALAQQRQIEPGLNLMMLGYLLAGEPLCSEDLLAWVLRQKLGPERQAAVPLNLTWLEWGTQLFERQEVL